MVIQFVVADIIQTKPYFSDQAPTLRQHSAVTIATPCSDGEAFVVMTVRSHIECPSCSMDAPEWSYMWLEAPETDAGLSDKKLHPEARCTDRVSVSRDVEREFRGDSKVHSCV